MIDTQQGALNAQRVDHLAKNAEAAGEEGAKTSDEKLWKVATGFEEIFLNMMLKSMRKTTFGEGLLGGGNDAKIYRDMLDSEVASQAAKSRELGLSGMIFEYLSDQYNGKAKAAAEKTPALNGENPAQQVANQYQTIQEMGGVESSINTKVR
jgi:Rod binding domain-containing protein